MARSSSGGSSEHGFQNVSVQIFPFRRDWSSSQSVGLQCVFSDFADGACLDNASSVHVAVRAMLMETLDHAYKQKHAAEETISSMNAILGKFFGGRGNVGMSQGYANLDKPKQGAGGSGDTLADFVIVRNLETGKRWRDDEEQEAVAACRQVQLENERLKLSRSEVERRVKDLEEALLTNEEVFLKETSQLTMDRNGWRQESQEMGRIVELGADELKQVSKNMEMIRNEIIVDSEVKTINLLCMEEQLKDRNRAVAELQKELIAAQTVIKEQEESHASAITAYKKEKEAVARYYALQNERITLKAKGEVRNFEEKVRNLQNLLTTTQAESAASLAEGERVKRERDQTLSKLSMLEQYVSSKDTISGSYDSSLAQPHDLQAANEKVREALRYFCADIREKLTSMCGGDQNMMWRNLQLLQIGVKFSRPAHTKCVLESQVAAIIFEAFENEVFSPDGFSACLDEVKRSQKTFQHFNELKKEEQWAIEERDAILSSFLYKKFCALRLFLRYQKCRATQANVSWEDNSFDIGRSNAKLWSLCKALWSLHKLAQSFDPPAAIFRVARGAAFDPALMELVPCAVSPDNGDIENVAFCVTPGFRVRKSVIPAVVYPVLP